MSSGEMHQEGYIITSVMLLPKNASLGSNHKKASGKNKFMDIL